MNGNLNDEIDIIEILKKIYNERKNIIYSTSIFIIIGISIALISPVKFSSYTIFIPQNQESSSSSLSGVANLVGINLGSSSFGGEIPSSMYPEISESPKFKRLLLEKLIDKKKNLTLKKFIVEYYKIDENNELVSNQLSMTTLEEKCFEKISEIISINVNIKDGFITINSIMPVAEYSAIVAKYSREILQSIIIENKIETARQNLIFSKKQLVEKKMEFDELQSKLANFSDSNINSVNSFVINEKNKLEAEFQIINSVVTELSKQVEQAKLQVTKDTPVFSTIREVVIPNKKTSPKRTQIVFIFGIVGFVLSCIYIVVSEPLKKIFNNIKQN